MEKRGAWNSDKSQWACKCLPLGTLLLAQKHPDVAKCSGCQTLRPYSDSERRQIAKNRTFGVQDAERVAAIEANMPPAQKVDLNFYAMLGRRTAEQVQAAELEARKIIRQEIGRLKRKCNQLRTKLIASRNANPGPLDGERSSTGSSPTDAAPVADIRPGSAYGPKNAAAHESAMKIARSMDAGQFQASVGIHVDEAQPLTGDMKKARERVDRYLAENPSVALWLSSQIEENGSFRR